MSEGFRSCAIKRLLSDKKERRKKKVKNNFILPRLFLKPRNFRLFLSFPENNLYDLNATGKLIGRLTVGSELIETPTGQLSRR